MILGMSVGAFTLLHVIITLVAIGSGLIVVGGMFASHRLPGTTALFLFTTALTSVTGFLFPIHGFTPALGVDAISMVLLAAALYLNVFVLIFQSFQKVPSLHALAPTQSEPPFLIAQVAALGIFLVLGIVAALRFRPALINPAY
jgi:hypothetical protein